MWLLRRILFFLSIAAKLFCAALLCLPALVFMWLCYENFCGNIPSLIVEQLHIVGKLFEIIIDVQTSNSVDAAVAALRKASLGQLKLFTLVVFDSNADNVLDIVAGFWLSSTSLFVHMLAQIFHLDWDKDFVIECLLTDGLAWDLFFSIYKRYLIKE